LTLVRRLGVVSNFKFSVLESSLVFGKLLYKLLPDHLGMATKFKFFRNHEVTYRDAVNRLKSNPPNSVEQAQDFLNSLTPIVQDQLISGLYLGRDNMNSSSLTFGGDNSRGYVDHISQDQYAAILENKVNGNGLRFLEKLDALASASSFDLNQL
jgi:hypothetical protein